MCANGQKLKDKSRDISKENEEIRKFAIQSHAYKTYKIQGNKFGKPKLCYIWANTLTYFTGWGKLLKGSPEDNCAQKLSPKLNRAKFV
jgi:hypothetical protein